MSNFRIEFLVSPWLLLLIIPALFLTLFPYFRMARRYRRTRNRVVSIVLHTIIMVLCISVLSGMRFAYDVSNEKNELVILVDSSFSNGDSEARADKANFINDVVEASDKKSKVALVKFGFEQEVVVGMGNHSANDVLERLDFSDASGDPDESATDIYAALEFVWNPTLDRGEADLIHNPSTAKILLLSDGLQTDQDAMTLARAINADGIRIDTVQFNGSYSSDREVRIAGVTFPEQNLAVSESFEIDVMIQSNFKGSVVLSGYDDDGSDRKELPSQTIDVEKKEGEDKFVHARIPYAFNTPGHHELFFTIVCDDDTLAENNSYYAYYDLIEFNKVLIIERYDGEADRLNTILDREVNPDNYFDVTVVRYSDTDNIPKTLDEMRAYDEIILCNISHADMGQIGDDFEQNLNDYVYGNFSLFYNGGGGVLTVGGQERDESGQIVTAPTETSEGEKELPIAHSYNMDDMKDTTYQKMLPVDVVEYTPPIAIVVILDQSASMAEGDTGTTGLTPLEVAGAGAKACLDVLGNKDWVGVMGLRESYSTALDMTPVTQRNRIEAAISEYSQKNEAGGSTMYYPAMARACLALSTLKSVERRHIVLISDGQPFDSYEGGATEDDPGWKGLFERYYNEFGISISIVSIGPKPELAEDFTTLCESTGGKFHEIAADKITSLPEEMVDEITNPKIMGVNPTEEYSPEINTRTAITGTAVTQENLDKITMTGFFGTRAKTYGDVVVPLNAKYVPLYAQWQYGSGMVGSFMCDLTGLDGSWATEFLDSMDAGVPIINNIVTALMPTSNIRSAALDIDLREDNYRTRITVHENDVRDAKFIAFIQEPAQNGSFEEGFLQKIDFGTTQDSDGNAFANTRQNFINKTPGVCKITVMKVPMNFDIDSVSSAEDVEGYQAVYETYRVLGYSEEYNTFRDEEEGLELLITLANDSEGKFLETKDPTEIFESFRDDPKVWDPRLAFIIIALILFLLDVTVRKFKWKWPHEVVRDRKARRAMVRN